MRDYDYAGKADLSKGYWNTKRKLGVTTHFPEIIKLQSGKIPFEFALTYTKATINIKSFKILNKW